MITDLLWILENDVFCHVVADGPANNPENPIESLYRQIIYNAREYLYIATPYLVIEDDLKEALLHQPSQC